MAGDAVWLDVLPDMGAFSKDLIKGSAKAAAEAGTKSGKTWTDGFKGAASDGGTSHVVAQLEDASKRTKRVVNDQVAVVSKARASERDATAKVTLAEQALIDAREKYGDGSARAVAAEQRLEGARDRQRAASVKLASSEDQLKAASNEHREVTKQLADATDKGGREANTASGKWDSLKASVNKGREKFDQAASSAGGIVAQLGLMAAGAATVSEAWSQNINLEAGTDKVAAALHLTSEQSAVAGQVAGSLYSGAWGESLEDVNGAVESVMSSIEGMADASPAELEKVTAGALDIAKAFDLDVDEAARNAGILMKTGLAADATEAFDLIVGSMQEVPKSLRGEMTDATQEYSAFFSQLGFDGATTMGVLRSALENGQFGIDKMGDSLKEFSIRSTDMSKSTTDAYETIGVDADKMTERILAGGDQAQGAFADIIHGLQGVKDPSDQAAAAIALFGTPLEDIGTGKIPDFLGALDPAGDAFDDFTGRAAEMGETLNDNTATGFTELKRSFVATVSDGLEPFMEPAKQVLDWANSVPGLLPAIATGLGVVTAAWGGYTVAQWAANAAILANPITWIITAVIAAAVLIIANWDTIKAAVKTGWDWLVEKVFRPIGNWLGDVGDWFGDMGVVIGIAWDGVQSGLKSGWDWINEKVFSPVKQGASWVGDRFEDAGEAIGDAWDGMTGALEDGWLWLNEHVFAPVKQGATWVGDRFEDAGGAIGDAWDGMTDALRTGWLWLNEHVFAPVKKGAGLVGDAFDAVPGVVNKAWSKIKEYAAKPVNFVIETVYMDGVRATWNKVADAVGLDLKLPAMSPVRFATGGVLPGYTPGRDVHSFVSPTGGRLELSGGEAIMRPEWTRAVGGPAAIARMNADARSGRFADGGVWGWAGDAWNAVSGAAQAAWDWAGNAAQSVGRFLSDPAGAIKEMITGPMNALLRNIGGGSLGQIVTAIPGMVVDTLSGRSEDFAKTALPPAGSGSPGMGWQAMVSLLREAFPGIGISSTYRPGAITATGVPSFHGLGRAVDIAPPRWDVFNWLSDNFPNSAELIYTPAGGRQIRNGQRTSAFAPITQSMHHNHIHWAMANGGVLPSPLLFDEGGWLPPGRSIIENRTGRPEPLARLDVERARAGQGLASMPGVLEVRDVDGALIGRMRVEAGRVFEGDVEPIEEGLATW
ncbi:phage tail tape measure protein [Isoptericola dokdonensis]|uniref:Phage-related minor tail protein n=1 Tax=Isoptericola dokdonensis DS-3 TaxID=1300344 RepID=A0A161IDU5_9MICO|nr:phage tail tape measure protein [Isoptericola dokdonensis]ANC31427.1 Phage-related minor tail protein [Isoptericola dokdonensis DS-3]